MRNIAFALAFSGLALGCTESPDAEQPNEVQEIVDNLVQAGFPSDDIMVVSGAVYVGRDAQVSLAASREMLQSGDSSKEQYHTNNLVTTPLSKICIDGSTFTGVLSTALDLAIQNYDEQVLTFAMARTPSSGCSFTIQAVIEPGLVGGFSGFPSGGLPFGNIHIGDGLVTFSVDTIEHVITHEIGHAIGFRHSDYYNRSISCSSGGNEGDAGIGAILIPHTPSETTVGGSIMNSCFRPVETGEFTATDLVALKSLYGAVSGPADFSIAFQANTSVLWIVGPDGPGSTGLGMMPGTSPSIARLVGGGSVTAYQANTGHLWIAGAAGTSDTGLGMMAGTSPSITALEGGGFEIAYQANTGHLWISGTVGTGDTGLGMMAGTSPSITALEGGGFEIAYQANTGHLWIAGTVETADTGFGMAANTSPSITGLATGGFEVAFQANTTHLWVTGAAGTADTGFGMAANTSPSIAARAGSGFDLVYQANTGSLWSVGSTGPGELGPGLAPNASPSAN